MSRTDQIRAIIAEHRGKTPGSILLADAVRARMGAGTSEAEIDDAIAFSREIVDAVPVLLDRVREALAERGIAALVEPVLAQAESYFVEPMDALSEATFGEVGLLDDAYLALSTIRMLQTGSDPLIQLDLDPPLAFLEGFFGEEVLARLQEEKAKAATTLVDRVTRLADAEARRRAAPPAPRAAPTRARSASLRQCGACSGTGTTSCSSCGGTGSRAVSSTRVGWRGDVEHVTEYRSCRCTGGRNLCSACGGSGYARG